MCQPIYTLLKVSRFGPLISKCTKRYSSLLHFRKTETKGGDCLSQKQSWLAVEGRKKEMVKNEDQAPPFEDLWISPNDRPLRARLKEFFHTFTSYGNNLSGNIITCNLMVKFSRMLLLVVYVCQQWEHKYSSYEILRILITTQFMWKK